jgi:hypothetical protein
MEEVVTLNVRAHLIAAGIFVIVLGFIVLGCVCLTAFKVVLFGAAGVFAYWIIKEIALDMLEMKHDPWK